MSDMKKIASFTVKGKLTIDFRQPSLPNPPSPPSSSGAGSSTASPPSTAGQPSPPSQVFPETQYTKSMVLDAVREELQLRQRVEYQEAAEEADQLYDGLQQVMGDLQFRIDDEEDRRRSRKRPRRE